VIKEKEVIKFNPTTAPVIKFSCKFPVIPVDKKIRETTKTAIQIPSIIPFIILNLINKF